MACSVDCAGVGVGLDGGEELAAQNVVLALGASEQPAWPDWAPRGDPRVQHVFEPGFGPSLGASETIAVVGGGISAAQIALRLLDEGHRVHLVSRHPLREHQFDSDPGWIGPKLMTGFSRVRDYDRRRAMIAEARHRGSVPPDVRRVLARAIEHGHLSWHEGQVEALDPGRDGIALRLAADPSALEVERVVLATGFSSRRPGGAMIDRLVASASLPCARCGYPIVDSALRWHPRIHVSGPLAELELGPVARNIVGARRTGDRLVAALRSTGSRPSGPFSVPRRTTA